MLITVGPKHCCRFLVCNEFCIKITFFVVVMQKHDVGKINKDECTGQIMESVGNGQPEENSSAVLAVNSKSVTDAGDVKSQSGINAAKPEEPVREKPDTNGSSSPGKRKPISEKSDGEGEDHGSPIKKSRSEPAEHSSDEEDANDSSRMSEEDVAGSPKASPKKRKSSKGFASDEDLARMYGLTPVKHALGVNFDCTECSVFNNTNSNSHNNCSWFCHPGTATARVHSFGQCSTSARWPLTFGPSHSA